MGPMSSFTVDTPEKAFLNEHDYTAVSFWIISIAMIASTVFFLAEAATVSSHWRTSLNVTYNIADFVNKIGFVLACWSCAKADTEATKDANAENSQVLSFRKVFGT